MVVRERRKRAETIILSVQRRCARVTGGVHVSKEVCTWAFCFVFWFCSGKGKGGEVVVALKLGRWGELPTLIHGLCSELHTGAIRPWALAGEGTHFDIVRSVGPQAVQRDDRLGRLDEELGGALRAVDVLVLQRVPHDGAVTLGQQHGLPAHLNGGGGGRLGRDGLRVAAGHVLGRADLFDRLLAEAHLVAGGQAEDVGGALVNFFGSVVVLALGELDDGQGLHVLAAEAEAVAQERAVGIGRRVPLEQGRAHVGGAHHKSRALRNWGSGD